MTKRHTGHGETEITIFGRHPVRDALRSDSVEVLETRCAKSLPAQDRKILAALAREAEVALYEVTRAEMTRFTGAERHDQGVAAKIRLGRVMDLETFVEASKGAAARRPLRLMALDGVTNSQNVGMVVRSVVGAGLDGLVWPTFGQPWVNGLVARAAAGSVFECPIFICENLAAGVATLQAAGFSAYGLAADAVQSLFDQKPAHRSLFVLGSEAAGISDEVSGLIDESLSIPMVGQVESLNVAVAAGLVCFHAAGLLAPRPVS